MQKVPVTIYDDYTVLLNHSLHHTNLSKLQEKTWCKYGTSNRQDTLTWEKNIHVYLIYLFQLSF